MRFSLTLPVDQVDQFDEFISAEAVMEMAAAMESARFDACSVTEHPFPTRVGPTMGGHHSLDPLVALAFAAAATSRLRLHTNAFIAPYRNPFVGAKGVSTLDAMARGRVILGVAPGYLAGEFAALGASLDDRGARLDEAIDAMRAAWTGEPVHLDGPGWSAQGNVMLPRPGASPHPPIWIGGNSLAAVRRAAARGDGWMPFPATPDEARAVRTASITGIADLAARIRRLHDERAVHGRTTPFDVCATPFTHQHHPRGQERLDPSVLLEEAEQLAEIGVTWLSIKLPSPDRATFLDGIARFGDEVIARQPAGALQ
jgi:probable F420-dependent oxidoreductase